MLTVMISAAAKGNNSEAVKKLECERFYQDFFADFKSHPLPQRPACRCGRGWDLKDAKKIGKIALHLYFFTASLSDDGQKKCTLSSLN
jgi:hypothetical protein